MRKDAINKQQAYGQALYDRPVTLSMRMKQCSKAAEPLVRKVMADEEVYVLLSMGKK